MSEATEIKDYLELIAYALNHIFDIDEPDQLIHRAEVDSLEFLVLRNKSPYQWAEQIYLKYGVSHES